jgi:hypothetical protein
VIAIKKHLADLGRPIRRTDKDDMGRVLHITLNPTQSRLASPGLRPGRKLTSRTRGATACMP